ncbi:MAG: hypothetical protein ACE5D0_02545 [Fidelibacterota bacterium]
MNKQIIPKEEGFVFAVTAMVVVVVLSLILIYLRSTVMLNISEASEIMSTSQSYWSAVSGMEYAFEESASNADSVPGTYSYYNSTITLESSLVANGGGPVNNGSLRFISTGTHGETKRIVESSFKGITDFSLWPSISVILESGESPGGEECGECDGKVTQLTLQYNGSSSASVKVKQKKGKKWKKIFKQTVSPGGTFTINGVDSKGTLGSKIKIFINGDLHVEIHTSCSEPIGAGMVAGSFEIISGYSRNGGLLCNYGDDECNDDDHDDDDDNGSSGFEINDNAILNCSIFIGGDVDVESSAIVGSPSYGGPTTIYVPTGNTVTGNFNSTFDWDIYLNPTPTLPNFNHSPYDSLINIADAISSTGGNEYDGDLEIELTTFDLSSYTNRTYFVDGDIDIKGSTITGAVSGGDSTLSLPGILVSSGQITIDEEDNTQSFIDDNIILIAKKDIKIKDYSQIGTDLSGNSPSCRPSTLTEVYSKDDVEIKENVVVWAIVTARGDLKLDGTLYGIAFVPDGHFIMDNSNAYMEGAIFVNRMGSSSSGDDDDDHDDHDDDDDGDCFTDGFNKGQMKLTHCFPQPYFSSRKFVPVKSTFKEI